MAQEEGDKRVRALRDGIERETMMRQDPMFRAARVVRMWQQLEAEERSERGFEYSDAHARREKRLEGLAHELKRDPQLESLLRNRRKELGISQGSRLDWAIRARTVEQAIMMPMRDRGLSR